MDPERIERIQELYLAVLELEPADREAYLDEACAGDRALREEVASLLAARDDADALFDQPVWRSFPPSTAGDEPEAPEREVEPNLPFERLGAFRLIRHLGEGGMGVVYLAVQEPLDREVALKILRPDRAGSFEAEKRFWREIKAASGLRHPGIVTVHETGEEQGVRYFAMELVSGRDLDDVLAEASSRGERIAIQKALVWAREIARALACAHEAGIVHRDVKPSNVRIDSKGRVKLMDFGVARHTNLSKMTLTGEFRGTPHYAAPEQVDSRGGAIDARTDVHALGVTLYEMVTGEVPFAGETTAQVFRQILAKDPVPPRRLNPTLSRDLETVILTALAKEPAHRYQTASDFADDLDRLMRGEMIHARPGGAVTRWVRRIRRNPALSGALGLALLALSALIVSVPWYVVRIKSEQAGAEREARKASTANEFLEDMFSSPDPGEDGREVRVVDVLSMAAARLATDFADEPEIEAFLRRTIGRTYYRLGVYDEAEEQLRIALELRGRTLGPEHVDTLRSMNDLGLVLRRKGRLAEAQELYHRALDVQRARLGPEHPDALDTLNNMANALRTEGRILDAEPIYREVYEARRRVLGEEDPDTLMSKSNLVSVYSGKGMLDEAERLAREVLESRRKVLGDEHLDTMMSLNNLAIVLRKQGEYSEAEELYRQALEIQRRELGETHADTLIVMDNLAGVLLATGDLEEAESLRRHVREAQLERYGETHAYVRVATRRLVEVLLKQDRLAEAEELSVACLEARRRDSGEEALETILALDDLAHFHLGVGRVAEAAELYREELGILQRSGRGEGTSGLSCRMRLGRALISKGAFAEALASLEEGLEIAERTLPSDDPSPLSLHGMCGECLLGMSRLEAAKAHLLVAYEGMRTSRGEGDRELEFVRRNLLGVRRALGEDVEGEE